MTVDTALDRRVNAGDIIKPWLVLGPYYEDVSATVQGLTLFEKAGAAVGREAMAAILADAHPILASQPREADLAHFRGQPGRWALERRPDQYLSWGTYHISNHLGAAFLSTVIVPEQPGLRQWQLLSAISLRGLVVINGQVAFDTDAQPVAAEYGVFARTFQAELAAGENVVTIGLFRLGRMAQVGCRLELLDSDARAHVRLGEHLSREARLQLEDEVTAVRLGRDVFHPRDAVAISVAAPRAGAALTVALKSAAGETLREAQSPAAGAVALCAGADVPDGRYRIDCTWAAADGTPITAASYDVRRLTPAPALPGPENYAARCRAVLEHFSHGQIDYERPDIWSAVSHYALGQFDRIDEGKIRETCDFIAARKDCADFVIQGLLRLMYWERAQRRLSDAIHAVMRETVLGFKYWVDEPGDTVMYMGSENHRLLFHVAEWLAGQLYPTEEFGNSLQRGLYHAAKGRAYITEWIRQRGRYGFDEWHSNAYYPICIAPLVNVRDFAISEDYKLRQMADAILDVMHFNIAADSINGVMGSTHGRSYGVYIKQPDMDAVAATSWLLFGVGTLGRGVGAMAPVALATSAYRPPAILGRIATDTTGVVESRQRQGILQGSARHADFCVYRTPDYLISGLQDHRKGEVESSTHVAQVTFPNRAMIFWSCPHTSGEGSGLRPDYWSGHTTLPRVIQHRNVMSLSWRLTRYAWMSHCFFERERFDESRLEGSWAFARAGKGYVGIWSQGGLALGASGPYAGRELTCAARRNTWLVECGREADWGSFEAFTRALAAARIEVGPDGEAITYHSPSAGAFVTGWDAAPSIDGRPIQLRGYPLVDSPWARAAFGAGEMVIRYGDEEYELWLNQ